MTSDDNGTRVRGIRLRVAVFNGLILAALAFLQGGLFGFGIGRVAAQPQFALLFILVPMLVMPAAMYMYWRSSGRLD